MTIKRVFLDWSRPALPAAVDHLAERYERDRIWDLTGAVIVLPGARAGRRLREILAGEAESRQRVLYPPAITTVGQLPELLYTRQRPFASRLVQKLAWAAALRSASPDRLSAFLADIPERADDLRWFETGTLLWSLHRELASDALDFEEVVTRGAAESAFSEADRWQALAKLQHQYLSIVDGLGLWDRQTARLHAIKHHECRVDRDILLLATVDMNGALRLMLDQVGDRVTALIHADASQADRFDAHGCLVPEEWQEFSIPLQEQQIVQVQSPADQGRAVVDQLAAFAGRYAATEITVGVPDENMIPLIEQQLRQAGLAARWGPGKSVEAAPPIRLLRIVIDYLQKPSYACLSELVRHPDIETWLTRSRGIASDFLAKLDDYQNQYLPLRSADTWHASGAIADVKDAIDELLHEMRAEPQQAADWTAPILKLLRELYGDRTFHAQDEQDRMILGGCEAVRDALQQLEQIPAALAPELPCDQALLMALDSMDATQIPAPPVASAIEMLGWLELPLDDAPALIVTGLNEGNVPTSCNSDLFLPNSLRSRLGLNDNQRRYARDAYALTVLTRARRQLCLILGRRDWQGDPLPPSRLLFATDIDTIIARSLRFFAETEANPPLVSVAKNRVDQSRHQFFVPAPDRGPEVKALRVTDFRAYLACPYRFYLERVLRLRRSVDDARELDGAAFGSVLHAVLERFGSGAVRDSTDEQEIAADLLGHLADVTGELFGDDSSTAVQVQIVQMQQRLSALAACQVEWRKRGWRIQEIEGDFTATWGAAGAEVELRGRIDRVDQNERTGEWAILDYKSSDRGDPPRTTHLGRAGGVAESAEDWVDLQLPLYRHFASSLGFPPSIQLGYVLLPRDISRTGFRLANWTSHELSLADQAARKVIERIRNGVFWPPADPAPRFSEPYASICQDQVFDRQLQVLTMEDRA